MRRVLLLLVLLLPSMASAQSFIRYYPPSSGGGGGGTGTGVTGCTTPGYNFADDTNAGLCLEAANDVRVQAAPAGASSSYFRAFSTGTQMIFTDASSNGTQVAVVDNAINFEADATDVLSLTSTLGTGFLVAQGSTAAVAREFTSGGSIVWVNGTGSGGDPTADVDEAQYHRYGSGTADHPAACGDTGDPYQIADVYIETDEGRVDRCVAIDTWVSLYGIGVSRSDTSTSGFGFVIDEDSFSTNSDTKVPTQQSVKAYVDASASSAFDPSTSWEFYEEFNSGTGTAGQLGANGLSFTAVSTGTINQNITGDANHPGLMRLQSHATNDNSGAAVWIGNSAGATNTGNVWHNEWDIDAVIIPGSNSTSIAAAGWALGLTDGGRHLDNANFGIWVRYDTDRSDSTYVCQICDASGANGCGSAADAADTQVAASTQTPVGGTPNRIRLRYRAAGEGGNPTIYCAVNDETWRTFCASGCTDTVDDLPTLATQQLTPTFSYLTRTTTGVITGDIDYLYVMVTGLARY